MIAIIAILAGMLLPALNSARGRARNVQCISNLKSLGVAQDMYVSEYNEYYNLRTMFGIHWTRILNTYIDPKATGNVKVKRGCVFDCPSLKVAPTIYSKIGYGYNVILFGKDFNKDGTMRVGQIWNPSLRKVGHPVKRNDIKQPAMQLVHADVRNGAYFGEGGEWIDGTKDIGLRHNRRFNMVCADGHVENNDWKFIWYKHPDYYPLNGGCHDKSAFYNYTAIPSFE